MVERTNKYKQCSCVRMDAVRRGYRRQLANASTARRMVVRQAWVLSNLTYTLICLLVVGMRGGEKGIDLHILRKRRACCGENRAR